MALKIELKPHEKFILGECVVTNGSQRARLTIQGSAPILRMKDIMMPAQANTPAKRIYLVIQLMYTSKDPTAHHDLYFTHVRDIISAAPSMWPILESINNHILMGEMYKALKDARKLIAYEKELMDHATRRESLQFGRRARRQPA